MPATGSTNYSITGYLFDTNDIFILILKSKGRLYCNYPRNSFLGGYHIFFLCIYHSGITFMVFTNMQIFVQHSNTSPKYFLLKHML